MNEEMISAASRQAIYCLFYTDDCDACHAHPEGCIGYDGSDVFAGAFSSKEKAEAAVEPTIGILGSHFDPTFFSIRKIWVDNLELVKED